MGAEEFFHVVVIKLDLKYIADITEALLLQELFNLALIILNIILTEAVLREEDDGVAEVLLEELSGL